MGESEGSDTKVHGYAMLVLLTTSQCGQYSVVRFQQYFIDWDLQNKNTKKNKNLK